MSYLKRRLNDDFDIPDFTDEYRERIRRKKQGVTMPDFDLPSHSKPNANELYLLLLEITSGVISQFAESTLQLITEYSTGIFAKCEICDLETLINEDWTKWLPTRILPTSNVTIPSQLHSAVWTTTEDIGYWYLLNLKFLNNPYQYGSQRTEWEVICGPCADDPSANKRARKAELKAGVLPHRKQWMKNLAYLIHRVRKVGKCHETFLDHMRKKKKSHWRRVWDQNSQFNSEFDEETKKLNEARWSPYRGGSVSNHYSSYLMK